MVLDLVHEGSTDNWHRFLQCYFRRKLQTADRTSYEAPLYVVRASSDEGWDQTEQAATLWASRNAAIKAQSVGWVLMVHDVGTGPEPHEFYELRCGMEVCCCLFAHMASLQMRRAQSGAVLDSNADS
jgi:hypothetical protein